MRMHFVLVLSISTVQHEMSIAHHRNFRQVRLLPCCVIVLGFLLFLEINGFLLAHCMDDLCT